MRKPIIIFAAAWLCVSVSCWQYDNPGDPVAASYQGYETVATVAEVKPSYPADGATVFFLVLSSVNCASADKYALQIGSSTGDFATPVYQIAESSSNTFSLADAGISEGTYSWRVKARNKSTGTWASDWSASAKFTITAISSTGISPTNSGTTSDTTPLLDWGDVADAAKYQVQVATSAAGVATATAVEVTASTYQMTGTLAIGDTRYWRVRSVNFDGVAGAWSATWSFSVVEPLGAMISVTGGTFQMGSTSGESDEVPVHSVTVSSFMIGKYEVTQSQYQQVMGSNPSSFTSGTDAPSRPVEQVTWYNAVSFCNALSALYGLNNVYTINGTTVTVDFTKNGYRLPTEAEWEFAARGGTSTQGYTYSGSNTVDTVGWYSSNSGSTTHPVGTKAANELGIYDMSGNVWEWCWDWYGSYSSTAQTNPTGASSGSDRVLRGGSWDDSVGAVTMRCASRTYGTPDFVYRGIGFRVARRQD